MKKTVLLLTAAGGLWLSSCGGGGQKAAEAHKGPVPVIFETDMGNDIDDALALDLLYKAADDGLIDLIGISNHKKSDYASEFLDIMNTWYGYPDIPVSRAANPVSVERTPDYTAAVCLMTDSDGRPAFARTKKAGDIEESVAMYRRLLPSCPDNSVVLVTVGFSTSLAALLDSPADELSPLTGKELVARKIKLTSVMGGSFGEKKRAEYNIVNDIPAAQKFFAEWPGQIVLSPFEVGKMVCFPGSCIENDFSWTPAHPLVEAYKAYSPMPYDRPSWDLTSVLYALHPGTDMFTRTESGNIRVDGQGYTWFTPAAGGNAIMLSVDMDQAARMKDWFVENVSRKPEHRRSSAN